MIAIVLLFLVINGLSFVWEDSTDKSNLQKRLQWYRFQRSSKAYLAWYTLQTYAIVTLLATTLDTSFASFPRVLLPIVGIHGYGFGGPRTRDLQSYSTGRGLNDIAAALVYSDIGSAYVFAQVLVTYIVFTAAALVLYIILACALCAIRGNTDRIGQLLKSRPIYILIRFTDLAYLPLVTFAAAQLTLPDVGMKVFAVIVGIILIGIGVPTLLTILTLRAKVRTLSPCCCFIKRFLLNRMLFSNNRQVISSRKSTHSAFTPSMVLSTIRR